jgi:hypothetical protein
MACIQTGDVYQCKGFNMDDGKEEGHHSENL